MMTLNFGKENHKSIEARTRFIQAGLCKIQGLFKDFSRLSHSFQGLEVYEKS